MKQCNLTVVSNRRLTESVYEMCLEGDTSGITAPGQFVNIALDGLYLRRPISVCDYADGSLKLIYKVVGEGTQRMSTLQPNTTLDVLVGLGNGFAVDNDARHALLVGGGVGVPPLYGLAKRLLEQGKKVTIVLGFNSGEELFYASEFEAIGAQVLVSTVDGSVGTKGFVTDAIASSGVDADYFYACGPLPMLRALYNALTIDGEMSFEERMGCGFGVCMGCSCKTNSGHKRLCKEGPVLKREDIIW